jgi:VWFA-related protein
MKTNVIFVVFLAFGSAIAPAQSESSPRVTGQESAAEAQVQINQIDTSQFPMVSIFATVLKDGEPVPGLSASDCRVREDEVDQEPITVTPKLTPLSVVLTLDTSGSMKKRLADAQSAAKSFLKTLQPQDKAQVIRFARDVKTMQPLSADRVAAEAAIAATTARGDTALFDALYASVESLRDVAGRKAILLLSDGVDDDGTGKPLSKKTVTDVLTLARQVNVPIYAIGLGTELDELALKKVATETGALYLNAVEASELKRLYDSIGKQLAGQYTIGYSSNLPADGTEHRIQLHYGGITSTKSYVVLGAAKASTAVQAAAPTIEKVRRIERTARTVTVLKPALELPEMEELLVITAGAADNPHAYLPPDTAGSSTRYGEPIRVAPDAKAEKFDVYWVPKRGKRLVLRKEIVFDAEHASYEIKPEEHLGIVRVTGKDSPKAKAIYLAEAGTDKQQVRLFPIQSAEASGENMPAPPGTYDLYIEVADEDRLELIAEKIEVKAGQVTEVE